MTFRQSYKKNGLQKRNTPNRFKKIKSVKLTHRLKTHKRKPMIGGKATDQHTFPNKVTLLDYDLQPKFTELEQYISGTDYGKLTPEQKKLAKAACDLDAVKAMVTKLASIFPIGEGDNVSTLLTEHSANLDNLKQTRKIIGGAAVGAPAEGAPAVALVKGAAEGAAEAAEGAAEAAEGAVTVIDSNKYLVSIKYQGGKDLTNSMLLSTQYNDNTLIIYNDNVKQFMSRDIDVSTSGGNGLCREFRSDKMVGGNVIVETRTNRFKDRDKKPFVLGFPTLDYKDSKSEYNLTDAMNEAYRQIMALVITERPRTIVFSGDEHFKLGLNIASNAAAADETAKNTLNSVKTKFTELTSELISNGYKTVHYNQTDPNGMIPSITEDNFHQLLSSTTTPANGKGEVVEVVKEEGEAG